MVPCPFWCTLLQVREGEIGPFESIKLEVVFTPTIPGEAKLDFHIKFSDVNSKPVRHSMFHHLLNVIGRKQDKCSSFKSLRRQRYWWVLFTSVLFYVNHLWLKVCWYKQIPIQVRGVAVSVPVCVVQPSIDLKICMFDRLYQDSVMVQSRWVPEPEMADSFVIYVNMFLIQKCSWAPALWHLHLHLCVPRSSQSKPKMLHYCLCTSPVLMN